MKLAITKMTAISLACVLLFFTAIYPNTTRAGEGKDSLPHHHLSLFLGLGAETKRDEADEKGFAIGLEYELRFHEHWGIGAAFEGLGHDTVRDFVVVVPVSLHPIGHWRVFAGPGYEFTSKKDKFLVRLGVGYEIPLDGHWSLAPEVIGDFVDGGSIIWIGGLALGYEF